MPEIIVTQFVQLFSGDPTVSPSKTENFSLLFITRNYPPTLGGLEKYSFDLYTNLKTVLPDVSLIANRNHLKSLPWFFVRTLIYLLFKARHFTNIHLADGSLSILIPYIKLTAPKANISISIHGLDITYKNYLYQLIIPRLIRLANAIVCVSNNTMQECCKRGVPQEKCRVITNGIDFHDSNFEKINLSEVEKLLPVRLSGKRILFSIGRLVKRKGIVWFIEHVMTKLDKQSIYVIAGSGRERQSIIDAVESCNLANQVFLLGNVSEEQKIILFRSADFFIMPNIRVENDIEGFGLTVLEAGKYGVTVLASAIEGLLDSVLHNKTGYLIEEQNEDEFVERLASPPLDRATVQCEAAEKFSWEKIVTEYRSVFLTEGEQP